MQRPKAIPDLKTGDAIADIFIPCVVIAVLDRAEGLNGVERLSL